MGVFLAGSDGRYELKYLAYQRLCSTGYDFVINASMVRNLGNATYSKIREGFQVDGSTIEIELDKDCCCCCWGSRCPLAIMTRDCTAGESPFVSVLLADIGGVIGWLV